MGTVRVGEEICKYRVEEEKTCRCHVVVVGVETCKGKLVRVTVEIYRHKEAEEVICTHMWEVVAVENCEHKAEEAEETYRCTWGMGVVWICRRTTAEEAICTHKLMEVEAGICRRKGWGLAWASCTRGKGSWEQKRRSQRKARLRRKSWT